jgi:hypothetical protein
VIAWASKIVAAKEFVEFFFVAGSRKLEHSQFVQQVLGTEKSCCLSNSTCDTFDCISELLRLEMSHLLSDLAVLHLQRGLIDLLLLGLAASRVSQLRHLLIHRLLSLSLLLPALALALVDACLHHTQSQVVDREIKLVEPSLRHSPGQVQVIKRGTRGYER